MKQLTLEDFEKKNSEFDISEAPDFLMGSELERFYATYSVITTFSSDNTESCGDYGICRSFPGASFYYD